MRGLGIGKERGWRDKEGETKKWRKGERAVTPTVPNFVSTIHP